MRKRKKQRLTFGSLSLATLVFFLKLLRGSGASRFPPGAGTAPRFAKPRGAGLAMGPGKGRRPSASLCGNAFGFAEEG
jgi:hypothetical protein